MPRKLVRRILHKSVTLHCTLLGLSLLLFLNPTVTRTQWSPETATAITSQDLNMSLPVTSRLDGAVALPTTGHPLTSSDSPESDFGGLVRHRNVTITFGRQINPRDEENYVRNRIALFQLMDREQPWELSANWLKNEDLIITAETGRPDDCQAPSWRSFVFPTCNTVHEYASDVFEKKVLGAGTSRMGWLVTPHQDHNEEFVLKQLILDSESRNNNDPPDKHLLKNQRETLIMERLSASPRVVDIYGACGTSSLVEAMVGDIMSDVNRWESDDREQHPSNPEKLDLAIVIAESIADMHGFEDGLIFNTDLSLVQFLVAKDGKIKLNDFNSAFIPSWSQSHGQYCKIQRKKWNPPRYPPEVILGNALDEGVDVFAFGDMLAYLWTGVSPIFGPRIPPNVPYRFTRHAADASHIQRQDIITDIFEQLMESLWEFKPSDRPNIFQILQSLKETRDRYQQQGIVERLVDRLSHVWSCLLSKNRRVRNREI